MPNGADLHHHQPPIKPPKTIYVVCNKCGAWWDEAQVKIFDISEDDLGRDVVVFECPDCKEHIKSLRIG